MVPPFECKDFFAMNKDEAEQHFRWYLSEVPDRIALLKEFIAKSGCNTETMDYSPNSLICLWDWYLNNVSIVLKNRWEYEQEILQYPEYVRYSVSKYKLETLWMAVAMDIGTYWALCFLEYDKRLHWGYFTKPPKLSGVNKPCVMGFPNKMEFCPADIMSTMVSRTVTGSAKDTELYETFNHWISQEIH